MASWMRFGCSKGMVVSHRVVDALDDTLTLQVRQPRSLPSVVFVRVAHEFGLLLALDHVRVLGIELADDEEDAVVPGPVGRAALRHAIGSRHEFGTGVAVPGPVADHYG